jgi:hypothetical protein
MYGVKNGGFEDKPTLRIDLSLSKRLKSSLTSQPCLVYWKSHLKTSDSGIGMFRVIISICVVLAATAVSAATIHVPTDQQTIQAGIRPTASDGLLDSVYRAAQKVIQDDLMLSHNNWYPGGKNYDNFYIASMVFPPLADSCVFSADSQSCWVYGYWGSCNVLSHDWEYHCEVVKSGSNWIDGIQLGWYKVGGSICDSQSCCQLPRVTGMFSSGRLLDGVIGPHPTLEWSHNLAPNSPQLAFVIEVSSDTNWTYAEMWNPAPLNSPDTFVTYAGAALVDGQTYYLRLRISDGVSWSNWYYTSFHMNTPPSVPYPYSPTVITGPTNTTPDLSIQNSTDPENDTLSYDFAIYKDSMLTQLVASATHVPEMHHPDSTSWTVSPPLDDNKFYYWKARAFDGYEYSAWSGFRLFIVNTANEPPTMPMLLYPPDSTGVPLLNRKPMLTWVYSTDPDPMDWVRYRFELSTDSLFTFKYQNDSLWSNWAFPPDSLPFGSHYWWRVTAYDRLGLSTPGNTTRNFWIHTLGDFDYSHNADIADLSRLIDYLYISFIPITPLKIADLDGDCLVDISDLSRLIDALFISLTPLDKSGCGP